MMKVIKQVTAFFQKNFPLITVALTIIGLAAPKVFLWARSYTTFFMSAVMFGMALTMEFSDFKILFQKPKITIVGVSTSYLISVGVAIITYKVLNLPLGLAVGLGICAACPGGVITDVMTFIANGDVPLSVGLSSVATLISPIATPGLVYLMFREQVEVNAGSMISSLIFSVALPVVLGIALKNLFRKQMEDVEEVSPLLSFLGLSMVIGVSVASNGSALWSMTPKIFIAVVVFISVPTIIGYYIPLFFKLTEKQCRTIAFETGLKNSVLGSQLAIVAFANLQDQGVALPGIIIALMASIIAPIFAKYWAKKDERLALEMGE